MTDEPKPSLPLDDVFANAPEARDGFFVVPAVTETYHDQFDVDTSIIEIFADKLKEIDAG